MAGPRPELGGAAVVICVAMNEKQQRVRVTVADGVADVRLDRADKLNALDRAMLAALVAAGRQVAENTEVRAVVLSGNGRAFCAGLDFAEFRAMTSDGAGPVASPDDDHDYTGPARALAQHAAYVWAELPVPVIAAVHGVAFGGGLQITLGADIRLAAPDAQLSVMEIKWGLIPDMTGSQLLPELVGRDVAKELTFTGRVLGGREAAELGLATRVSTDPLGEALTLATEIAGKSPQAIRAAKYLLDQAGRVSLRDGFAAEQQAIRRLIGSSDQVEAVRANLEGRAPVFTDD
jgi:enoyl-CoA hydratase/carnithine racemase